VEKWKSKEEEDLLTLKASIITQSSSTLDVLAQFASHVLPTNTVVSDKFYISLPEDELKAVAVQLLRWMQFPQLEIVFSAINVVTLLITDEKSGLVSIPISLLMLLTNGLFNRLADPAAFAIESDKTGNKNLNVKRSSLLVMDSCINAIIDLHSTDNVEFHNLFIKLQGISKLEAAILQFHSRYQQIMTHLEEDDRDKVEETAMNLTNFIEYKNSSFR
jgi:hypothetical protein